MKGCSTRAFSCSKIQPRYVIDIPRINKPAPRRTKIEKKTGEKRKRKRIDHQNTGRRHVICQQTSSQIDYLLLPGRIPPAPGIFPNVMFWTDSAPRARPDPALLAPSFPFSNRPVAGPIYEPESSLPFLSALLTPSLEANCPTGVKRPLSPTWFPIRLDVSSWILSTWSMPVTFVLERVSTWKDLASEQEYSGLYCIAYPLWHKKPCYHLFQTTSGIDLRSRASISRIGRCRCPWPTRNKFVSGRFGILHCPEGGSGC